MREFAIAQFDAALSGRSSVGGTWRMLIVVLGGVFGLLGLSAQQVLAQALSVEQFNGQLKDWQRDKSYPATTLRIEGRVLNNNRQFLQLRKCELVFVGEPLANLPQGARNVEVRGKLSRQRDTGKVEFAVEALTPLGSDEETFKSRRDALRGQPARKWHELADWAAGRGRFYDDAALLELARDARTEGLQLELKEVAEGDEQGLLELADRAKKLEAGPGFIQAIDHQAVIARYQTLDKASATELEAFLKLARERLPGCETALPAFDEALRDKYLRQPLTTYRGAVAGKRGTLHRFLYAEVERRLILSRLKPDYSNANDVAVVLERQIPEERARAARLREDFLKNRALGVGQMTRSELVALEAEYRLRGQPDEGRRLVGVWLTGRREKLDPEDVDGAVDLANDYVALGERPEQAAELLKAVWSRVPGTPLLSEKLEALGYRQHEGRWLTPREYEGRPESRFEKAIRAGRVENGMNQDQARKALGPPHRISRIATVNLVSEYWTYELGDSSRMVVRLERRRGQSEMLVTGAPMAARP